MAKLPWFKFYVSDWMGSSRVRRLSGDQMAAYVWLLCEQWERGSLPFDVTMVTPGIPKGISDTAVAYILENFFPPDPDTNRRRNPKLAALHDIETAKYEVLNKAAAHARASKASPRVKTKPSSNPQIQTQIQTQKKEEDVSGVPESVLLAAKPYLSESRTARLGILRSLLQGMNGRPIPEPALVRGLEDMQVAGAKFTSQSVRGFARRAVAILEGEAGQRAAQGDSSILGQSDAKQGQPSGWSEDEAEG